MSSMLGLVIHRRLLEFSSSVRTRYICVNTVEYVILEGTVIATLSVVCGVSFEQYENLQFAHY
jgi:hypothetical protein